MLRTLYTAAGEDRDVIEEKLEGYLKEEPCPILGGQTPRWAMQSLGTEWRNMIDANLWSNIWQHRVSDLLLTGQRVVCTDVRFHHEADMIKSMGGRLVRISRGSAVKTDLHPSEQEMLEIKVDFEIDNSGTMMELVEKTNQFMDGFL
jgi:hypothetical protein